MPEIDHEIYQLYRTPTCGLCGKDDVLFLNQAHVRAYKNGALIQDAFPTLPPDKREQIKTGMHGACWDRLIPPMED